LPPLDDSGVIDAGSADASSGEALVLRLQPAAIAVQTDLQGTPAAIEVRAIVGSSRLPDDDVTDQAVFTVGDHSIASMSRAGELRLSGIGGQTTLVAAWGSEIATATLAVKLTGAVLVGGASQETVGELASGRSTAGETGPELLYPLEGSVMPGNLAPPELQWTQAGDSDAYAIHIVCDPVLDVRVYTTTIAARLSTADWTRISESALDSPIRWSVAGVGPSGRVRTSSPSTLIVTSDLVQQPTLYFHTERGRLGALDVVRGVEFPIPTDRGPIENDECTGCHNTSRDGSRMVYASGTFHYGTLRLDPDANRFVHALSPLEDPIGELGAFASIAGAPAALLQETVDLRTTTVTLQLLDPDTGVEVSSNIADAIAALDPLLGRGLLMPDFAPDGSLVSFVVYDPLRYPNSSPGALAPHSAIVLAPVDYDVTARRYVLGAPFTLVEQPTDPRSTSQNIHPAFSPDGSAIAFLHREANAAGMEVSSVMLIRARDRFAFASAGGAGDPAAAYGSGPPRWAPWIGRRYAWVAFSSTRPYGVRSGIDRPTRHLWMMAVDLSRLADGMDDPSSPPIYLPGQDPALKRSRPLWPSVAVRP
jgi:hypothetical protein